MRVLISSWQRVDLSGGGVLDGCPDEVRDKVLDDLADLAEVQQQFHVLRSNLEGEPLRASGRRVEVGDVGDDGGQMRELQPIVGAVTDYSPYYPPRMGLAVNWYAANPGFHRAQWSTHLL